MSDLPVNVQQELLDLASAISDQSASDEQLARLEELLAGSAAARLWYVRWMDMHFELQEQLPTTPVKDAPTPEHQPRTRIRQKITKFFTRPTSLSLTVAALVIGLIVTVMAFTAAPFYRTIVRDDDAPVRPSYEIMAEVTGVHEAEWGQGQLGAFLGAHLVAGRRLELVQGVVEIEFRDGAKVVLEGPATLTIDGCSQVSLEQGRLTARVESPVEGFAVVTSAATFVDLGTEFGVDTGDGDAAEVHVFEGIVEARITSRDGGGIVVHKITEEGALRVDGATRSAKRLTAARSRFVHNVPRWMPVRVVNASFEEPRLDSGEPWRRDVAGWTASDSDNHGVSTFGREFAQRTPHGAQMAFLNEGALSQQLTETLQADTKYRLTVCVGNRPGGNSPNYSIELWAGDEKLVESVNEIQPEEGRFGLVVLNYKSPPEHEQLDQPLNIVLRSGGSLATKTQNHFDDIRLSVVPISSTDSNPHELPIDGEM